MPPSGPATALPDPENRLALMMVVVPASVPPTKVITKTPGLASNTATVLPAELMVLRLSSAVWILLASALVPV